MMTSFRNRILQWLAISALLMVPATLLGSQAGPLLTPSSLGLHARHDLHVSKMDLACDRCHEKAGDSTHASELLLPESDACAACHAGADCDAEPEQGCTTCHLSAPVSLLSEKFKHAKRTRIVFDHFVHVSLPSLTCETCHRMHPTSPDDHNPALPAMQRCIGCHPHDDAWETDSCAPCHLRTKKGTILVTAPGVVLTPPSWMHGAGHGGEWIVNHASSASSRPGFCRACHTEMDCAACHAGQVKPASLHPGDWIQFHPVASALGQLRCSSCHSYQHFCMTCHRKAGVAWDSPSTLGVPAGDVFHPPGWYSLTGNSKHAKQARKNLTGCVSCHTESDCISCHSATALVPVSPHPPLSTWLSKCKTLAAKNPTTCLKCHTHVASACQ